MSKFVRRPTVEIAREMLGGLLEEMQELMASDEPMAWDYIRSKAKEVISVSEICFESLRSNPRPRMQP